MTTSSSSRSTARSLLILYGSETGCAQEVAERVLREARNRRFHSRISAMDDYDKSKLLDESVVIFICSTAGQGDPPSNMRKFWRFLLRKSLQPGVLEDIKVAVFGLGDSSYAKYNFMGKKLYKRLLQLGAQPIVERGDGNDQDFLGVDQALDPWLQSLWVNLMDLFPLAHGLTVLPDSTLPPPSFTFKFITQGETVEKSSITSYGAEISAVAATLLVNQRLTHQDHFQDTRHLVFKLPDNDIHQDDDGSSDNKNGSISICYNPGDVLSVRPQNLAEDVDKFIDFFGWKDDLVDKPFLIVPNITDTVIPKQLNGSSTHTLRSLLTHYFDINGRPRRYFFQLLSHFAADIDHAEKLREFASAAGQEDLYAYCYRVRRTVFEVIQDFHSVKPVASSVPTPPLPLTFTSDTATAATTLDNSSLPTIVHYLMDLIPGMRCRSFSISSSQRSSPTEIHLTVAIVKYKTKLKTPRHGVCSKWLAELQTGSIVPIQILPGTFQLPVIVPSTATLSLAPSSSPVILIGPGTGMAPMRAILQDRVMQRFHDNVMFFGCRGRDKDFYYRQELEAYVEKGQLQLFTAFSRDQEQKIYVQHLIQQQGQLVWQLISESNAYIYISGNSNQMPKDVASAFCSVFRQHGGMTSESEVDAYMASLEKQGRYQLETWM